MIRGLQIVLLALSLVPLYFAVTGLMGGAAAHNGGVAVSAGLENQFMYLSAFYLILTMLIWWIIPRVVTETTLFRIIILAVFLGGLARLYAYKTVGAPPPLMMGGMLLELGAPILMVWQAKLKTYGI